jgi:hypothetical protein
VSGLILKFLYKKNVERPLFSYDVIDQKFALQLFAIDMFNKSVPNVSPSQISQAANMNTFRQEPIKFPTVARLLLSSFCILQGFFSHLDRLRSSTFRTYSIFWLGLTLARSSLTCLIPACGVIVSSPYHLPAFFL